MKKGRGFLCFVLSVALTLGGAFSLTVEASSFSGSVTVALEESAFQNINGWKNLIEATEKATGLDIEVVSGEGSAYDEMLEETFAGSDWPDVVMLDASSYAEYAMRGALWDMTEYYESSALSERIADESEVESWELNGKLYGLPLSSAAGYVTYINQDWLENCGLLVPTNYEEFLAMCRAFTAGDPDENGVEGDTCAIVVPGVISDEAPYVNLLAEFYQDAYPGFYLDEEGNWVDGFSEDAFWEALERIRSACLEGLIDTSAESLSECVERFCNGECGVISYWAGMGAEELSTRLIANGFSGDLVVLEPIEEVGAYLTQPTYVFCITTACENPEKVFDLFLSSLLDGGDVEFLWTYGVEGKQWSVKAAKIAGVTYEEGEFHQLMNARWGGASYTRACIDPFFALVSLTDSSVADPLEALSEVARLSAQVFSVSHQSMTLVPCTDALRKDGETLLSLKTEIVTEVTTGGTTVTAGRSKYLAAGGEALSQAILESLNEN